MKKLTKALSFLLTLAMVVGLMPGMSLTAYADSDIDTPLTFQAKDNEVSVSVTFPNGSMNCKIGSSEKAAYTSGTSISLNAGDTVQFYGNNIQVGYYNIRITVTGKCYVYGNVMSLLYGDNFSSAQSVPANAFKKLFYNNKDLLNHETRDLVLPVTTLKEQCYQQMFEGCTSLTEAPALPATTLANFCYQFMFEGCTSLTRAPELPVTSLAEGCYNQMFLGCTSLTEAPALPATTLAKRCYYYMFSGCTSLTEAPALPATTLAEECYYSMFKGCTSLTKAPALPATTLAAACYRNMFSGCTSLTEAPELPATTLVGNCYNSMFNGCTSLTKAPELPATTLEALCYRSMFEGCTSLNAVTCLATVIPDGATFNWLNNVASSGTFTKAEGMNGWTQNSASGIPEGWTVQARPTYIKLDEDTAPTIEVTKATDNDGEGPQIGDTLTAATTPNNATPVTYQWYIVDESTTPATETPIDGKTEPTLVLTKDEVGKKIGVKVSQEAGTDAVNPPMSSATSAVAKKTPATLSLDDAKGHAGISYPDETATPASGYEVSTDGTNAVTSPVSLTDVLDGNNPKIYVRTAETDETAAGQWVEVTLTARPDAPTGLTTENATNSGTADGKIKGTTAEMEYSSNNGDTWTSVSGTTITELKPGTYQVRVKATSAAPHGAAAEVTVGSNYTALSDSTTVVIKKDDNEIGSTAPVVDDVLTVVCGASDVTYQWYRGDEAIENAIGASYTVTKDDVGKAIKVIATQTKDANGNEITDNKPTKASDPTSAVVKKASPAAPANAEAASFVPDYVAETYTIGDAYEVSSTNSETATPVTSLTSIIDGTGKVYIRLKETTETYAGTWLEVTLASRPTAPSGLGSTNATHGTSADGTITNANNTMEYSEDGTTWTPVSGTTITGLNPDTYQVRVKATSAAPHGAAAEVAVGSNYTALSDSTTVVIKKGDHEIGSTAPVVDDVLTVVCGASDVTYQWYRGDEAIENAIGASYTVTKDDVGKAIKVVATQTKDANGNEITGNKPTKTSEPTVEAVKKDSPAAPANAEAASFVPDYLAETYTIGDAYEVSSTNSETATPVNSLTSIINDTGKVYIRLKETTETYAGAWLEVTLASRPTAPSGLDSTNATNGTSADGTITGVNNTMEYSTDGTTWTSVSGETITGLNPGEYQVRVKATEAAPYGLSTTVTVGNSYKALDDSTAVTITIPNEHTAPVVDDVLTASCEASFVTYQWYRGDEAIENAIGASYTVTKDDVGKAIKVIATQTKDANGNEITGNKPTKASEPTSAAVKKASPAAPVAPTPSDITKTDTTITINAPLQDGEKYEYSIDGGTTWQVSNEFTGLDPDTSYSVTARIKETEDTNAGTATTTLSVTTYVTVTFNPEEPIQGKAISAVLTPVKEGVTYKWYFVDDNNREAINGVTGAEYVTSTSGKKLAVEVFDGDTLIGTAMTENPIKSLSDYIAELDSTETIILDGPVSGDILVPEGKEIIIDLNGQTIDGTITCNLDGQLTIKDSSTEKTGTVTGKVTNNGSTNIYDGIFNSDVDNGGGLYIWNGTFKGVITNKEHGNDEWVAVSISDGKFDKRPVAAGETIYILGGAFKTDPTKLDGGEPNPNVIISSYDLAEKQFYDLGGEYPYRLGVKAETIAEIKVDQGSTVATLAEGVDESARSVAESATANLETATLNNVDKIVSESDEITEEGKNIVIVPALKIEVEEYTSNSITLEIEAVFTSYETVNGITTASEVQSNINDADKVKQIGTGNLDTTGTAVVVKFEVPAAFAQSLGANTETNVTVYVKHNHEGKNYQYDADLYYEGGKYYVEFTNPNGFSTFTLNATNEAVVTVYGRYYTDLTSALDDINDGGTLTLCKDDMTEDELTGVINSEKTVTISKGETNNDLTKLKITGGSGLNITKTVNDDGSVKFKAARTYYSPSTYSSQVAETKNGKVVVTPTGANAGTKVTITAAPDEGYVVDKVIVKDANGNIVTVTKVDDNTYTFIQPKSDVTIEVTFKLANRASWDKCPKDNTCPISEFTDADANAWYHDGVHFVLENKLMSGYGNGKFGPADYTSRAMVAQILWNLEGKPASTYEMSYSDVADDAWYANAIRWATENGVVTGYGDGKFGPDDNITREQLAAIIYRYAQSKGQGFTGMWMFRLDYEDAASISDWASEAMHWMVMKGIIKGQTEKTLAPKSFASRAEIATMIMRYATLEK